MKKKQILLAMSIATIAASCDVGRNPFYEEYSTPYGVPAFAQIQNKHYAPAFREGMAQQWVELNAIVADEAAPTFANTIMPLERSGALLYRVNRVFNNLYDAEANEEMDAIAKEITPLLSKHNDSILLHEGLFARIKAVYDVAATDTTFDAEDRRLLDKVYRDFVHGGANLSPEAKSQLKRVNAELATVTLLFQQNLLTETNAYKLRFASADDVRGLPDGIKEQAVDADGGLTFTLKNPSIMGFLQYADDRDLRRQILDAYATRSNNDNEYDNKSLVAQIVELRYKKGRIMGYNTYANYVLDECMAKNQDNVYALLLQIWAPALQRAKQEAAEQQALLTREHPDAKLAAADWRYYAEKIRKQNYDLDDEQLRPYLKLENVQQGVFILLDKLFGLQFEPVQVPVYHKDVTCYAVKEKTGELLGLLYCDYFPRAGKRGGAWMTDFREQYYEGDERIIPIVSLVYNFTPPAGETPSLLTMDEAETMFHETGHAIHSLLSNVRHRSLAGTNTSRDYVEMPSQILENWAFAPELLAEYAKHYQTGEVIPKELIDKMERSSKYGQGFATTELVAAALLDMDYHSIVEVSPHQFANIQYNKHADKKGKDKVAHVALAACTDLAKLDVAAFEKGSMDNIGLIPEILPRYRSTYFNHIFSNTGYDAGYYSYLWSETLDADGFEAFKETGDIFNKEVAERYRKNILERGNTEEPMALYVRFRGREPEIKALMERRGL